MNKILENGSLYAVPSTNIQALQADGAQITDNQVSVIAKPNKFLRDKEITSLYKQFKGEIDRIREDEEKEAKHKKEI